MEHGGDDERLENEWVGGVREVFLSRVAEGVIVGSEGGLEAARLLAEFPCTDGSLKNIGLAT